MLAEWGLSQLQSGMCVRLCAQDGGSVTAGNSSPITDGACALVLVSAAKAAELGCPVLAVVRGYGDANQDPEWFTTGAHARIAAVSQRQQRLSAPSTTGRLPVDPNLCAVIKSLV